VRDKKTGGKAEGHGEEERKAATPGRSRIEPRCQSTQYGHCRPNRFSGQYIRGERQGKIEAAQGGGESQPGENKGKTREETAIQGVTAQPRSISSKQRRREMTHLLETQAYPFSPNGTSAAVNCVQKVGRTTGEREGREKVKGEDSKKSIWTEVWGDKGEI